jgi:hypothetical protein
VQEIKRLDLLRSISIFKGTIFSKYRYYTSYVMEFRDVNSLHVRAKALSAICDTSQADVSLNQRGKILNAVDGEDNLLIIYKVVQI